MTTQNVYSEQALAGPFNQFLSTWQQLRTALQHGDREAGSLEAAYKSDKAKLLEYLDKVEAQPRDPICPEHIPSEIGICRGHVAKIDGLLAALKGKTGPQTSAPVCPQPPAEGEHLPKPAANDKSSHRDNVVLMPSCQAAS